MDYVDATVNISGGLRGVLTGLQPGAPTFKKSLICEECATRCNGYHHQFELISRRSVLTHSNCFVDIEVVDSLVCGLIDTH